MRKNIFRELKRIISQYFETEYWYRFRQIPRYWYDDDSGKYQKSEDRTRARDIITSTWNGENDIYGVMLLKLEHMYHNLKHYAWQANFYIDAFRFFEKGATDNDRALFCRQVLDKRERNPEEYEYSSEFNHTETWWNLDGTESSKKQTRTCKYRDYENTWWIGNETVTADISSSELVHYYLFHAETFDGWGYNTSWGIKRSYDNQIPPETIPEKLKLYYVDMDSDTLDGKEAPQYKTKKEEIVCYVPSCFTFKNIQSELDKKGIKINIVEGLLTGAQTMDVSDMKVFSQLSPYMKSCARGKRRVLTDLLALRHMVKKLDNMSDMDDKYYYMWKDLKGEEASKKLIEAGELFNQDRKELLHKIADFIAENGGGWWD